MKHSSSQLDSDSKLEFFLAASHQLKTPVAVIQWCLQTVLEDKHLDPKDEEMIRKSIFQAQTMSALIHDMLHMFRITDSKREQTFTPVDLNALLDQVFAQYEVVARKRGVHLIKGAIETLPKVLAEEGYLKQAVINLVDNGIKYSRSGGKVTVDAKAIEKGQWVHIDVTDTGIGIPEAEQKQLFTEFFRGSEAQKIAQEGTGLGLVLVKHIAEVFGGEIQLESTVGKGSTFTLRLPAA